MYADTTASVRAANASVVAMFPDAALNDLSRRYKSNISVVYVGTIPKNQLRLRVLGKLMSSYVWRRR